MIDDVKFKRIIGAKGNTPGINIPKELMEYMELTEGDLLTLVGSKGKKGKFIAIWKEEQE